MTKLNIESGKRKTYQDPKFWVLIGLIVLIGIVLMTNGRGTPIAAQKSKPPAGRKQEARASASKLDPLQESDPQILVSKLNEKPEEYESGNRNLFVFFTPPPPQPKIAEKKNPAPPPPPVCGDGRCEGGENYQSCQADCPPPPPPEIALKFIGYLLDKNRSVAFLTDGKEVFMGRENDIIANKYRILKITSEGVELGYLNLNTKQSRTIPYQGNNES
jgi:hypothetical protein